MLRRIFNFIKIVSYSYKRTHFQSHLNQVLLSIERPIQAHRHPTHSLKVKNYQKIIITPVIQEGISLRS